MWRPILQQVHKAALMTFLKTNFLIYEYIFFLSRSRVVTQQQQQQNILV